MKEIRTTGRFERDLRLAAKRGKEISKIEAVLTALAHQQPLNLRHRPHRLQGTMKGYWECHIESDWLLIWDERADHILLLRTGTHSDLFG